MPQTFADLQTQSLGNDFSSTAYLSMVKQAINDCLDLIARQGSLPLLQGTYSPTLVAGTATVAAPSDGVRITSAEYTDGQFDISGVEITDIDSAAASSGRPYWFALFDNVISLYPTPDQAYPLVFRYLRDPASLTADTADVTSIMPDSYANMVVAFARHRLFRAEDDVQMSQFWRAEFERDFRLLKVDLQRPTLGQPRQVPGPWRRRVSPRFMFP